MRYGAKVAVPQIFLVFNHFATLDYLRGNVFASK